MVLLSCSATPSLQQPTIKNRAVVRSPKFLYGATDGKMHPLRPGSWRHDDGLYELLHRRGPGGPRPGTTRAVTRNTTCNDTTSWSFTAPNRSVSWERRFLYQSGNRSPPHRSVLLGSKAIRDRCRGHWDDDCQHPAAEYWRDFLHQWFDFPSGRLAPQELDTSAHLTDRRVMPSKHSDESDTGTDSTGAAPGTIRLAQELKGHSQAGFVAQSPRRRH